MLISRSFINAHTWFYNKFLVNSTQKMAQKQITNFFKPKAEIGNGNLDCTNKRLSTSSPDTPQKKRQKLKTPSPKLTEQTAIKSEQLEDISKSITTTEKEEKEQTSPTKTEIKLEAVPVTVSPQAKQKEQKQNMLSVSITDKDSRGLDYDPSKLRYHPIEDAFWQANENTPYLALAKTFEKIEEIRSRLRMIEVLSNLFASIMLLNPDDLLPCIYLSINTLAPAYEGLELGVAETILMKIICKVTGNDMQHIKSKTLKTGDLGLVAEQSRVAQRTLFRPAALTIQSVFLKLKKVANQTGKPKADLIEELFVACRSSEARYLVRSLIGKLRIGMAEQSLLQALAIAVVKTDGGRKLAVKSSELDSNKVKSKIEETAFTLKTVYSQCPNYDKIIPTLLKHGMDELVERCPMSPGIPIKPMLAQPMKGVSETLERLQNQLITCEWKYDGERAQIHCDNDGVISIYSRNQENNTGKYPDVIGRISEFKKSDVNTFMIDSEIVAWDVEKKQILPFQVLTTRKRKNVELDDIKVQVCVFAFDLLYFNGESLVTQNFVDRRRKLKEHFQEVAGIWQFPTFCDTEHMDEVQRFLEESIKGNCEGLMIKTLNDNATYEISKRSHNWLKLKKDYLSNLGDSLDLVVIGGYWGKGKRTGNFGGFLLACYDSESEEFQSICKIGTGFSDEDLKQHADLLKQHIIKAPKSYYAFDQSLQPDEWFEPVHVWEIKCADLSLSPVHKAGVGIVDAERGISLRFPRFIRIREDKSAEDATSAQEVARMYSNQDQIKNQKSANAEMDMEDGFY